MTDEPRPWTGLISRAVRGAFGRALLVFAILVLNPFGVVEWADVRSRHIWQEIYADHYGGKEPRGREAITVVTLDEESFRSAAPPDSLPDSIHLLNIFRTVHNDTEYKGSGALPRAIFIDLLLGDFAPDGVGQQQLLDFASLGDRCPEPLGDRLDYGNPGVSPFACMLKGIADITAYRSWSHRPECMTRGAAAKIDCIIAAKGTPVLVADSTDPAERKATIASAGEAALAAVAVATPVLVNERGYPLVHPQAASDRANAPYSLYPAALLYDIYCRACEERPVEPADRMASPAWRKTYWGWSRAFQRPVEVVWGVGSRDKFTDAVDTLAGGTYENGCRPADPDWGLARGFLRTFFGGISPDRPDPCIYTHGVPYRLVRWPRGEDEDIDVFRTAALKGKLVLIGMTTPDSNDFIAAGPHGQLPGVFYHAMALDNLIQHGSDYSAVPEKLFPPFTITDRDFQNAALAFVAFFIGGLIVQFGRIREGGAGSNTIWRTAFHAAAWTVVATSALMLFLYVCTGTLFPNRSNFVALSLVVVLELFKIVGVLSRPIVERLGESNAIVRRIFGLAAPSPRKARKPRAERGGDAGTASDASRRRRRAAGDTVQSVPPDPL